MKMLDYVNNTIVPLLDDNSTLYNVKFGDYDRLNNCLLPLTKEKLIEQINSTYHMGIEYNGIDVYLYVMDDFDMDVYITNNYFSSHSRYDEIKRIFDHIDRYIKIDNFLNT